MTIAKGVAKTIAYKKEQQWGQLADQTGAKELRRVSANMDLLKETYLSNEVRTEQQEIELYHGVRSTEGFLNAELTHNDFSDFIASILSRDFTSAYDSGYFTCTVAGSGSLWTLTRATGDWFLDNIKIGSIVRLVGSGLSADNTSKNLLVVNASTSALSVLVLNGTSLVAEGPIADCRLTPLGKTSFVPAVDHTDDSYTVEQWFNDIQDSEVFSGVKVNSMTVSLPSNGLATIDFNFVGKDLAQTGSLQYFTGIEPKGIQPAITAVNGAVIVNGSPVAVVTSADFSVEKATENAVVIGSRSIVEIFTGRTRVNGNLSVYFSDAAFRNYFDTESDISLVLALTTGQEAQADFISFVFPRVRIGSFIKSDTETGLTASCSFVAILNASSMNALPTSTIQVQYSSPWNYLLLEQDGFLLTESGESLLLD